MIGAGISKDTRKAVYRREGYACAVCNSTRQLEIHHAVKRSQGGSNDQQNLVCLCHRCHCVAHGERPVPQAIAESFPFTADDMDQAIVEYLADYYAETFGTVWWPWTTVPPVATRDMRRHSKWPLIFPPKHESLGPL